MKHIAAVVFAALLLVMPCFASPTNITAGPYKVSFDLGTQEIHHVESELAPGETLNGKELVSYQIDITSSKGDRAGIQIIPLDEPRYNDTKEELMALVSGIASNYGILHDIATRKIDGTEGVIAEVVPLGAQSSLVYYAVYKPTLDTHNTYVCMYSTYPLQEGTEQLLNTIHVERQ